MMIHDPKLLVGSNSNFMDERGNETAEERRAVDSTL
jgi:hypothetical protein